MKKLIVSLYFAVFFLGFINISILAKTKEIYYEGVIQKIESKKGKKIYTVSLTSKEVKGKIVKIQEEKENQRFPVFKLKKNDKVIVYSFQDENGKDKYFITDYVRRKFLLLLFDYDTQ